MVGIRIIVFFFFILHYCNFFIIVLPSNNNIYAFDIITKLSSILFFSVHIFIRIFFSFFVNFNTHFIYLCTFWSRINVSTRIDCTALLTLSVPNLQQRLDWRVWGTVHTTENQTNERFQNFDQITNPSGEPCGQKCFQQILWCTDFAHLRYWRGMWRGSIIEEETVLPIWHWNNTMRKIHRNAAPLIMEIGKMCT